MKSLILSLLLALIHSALSSGLLERAACNADNCARAVTGTNAKPAMSIRQTDCSNFMTATITPTAATVTVTVPNAGAKRAVTLVARQNATVIPTYASACSGASRYSSACSCWGLTASTTTGPAPATSTVTITATPSTTAATTPTTTTTTTGINPPPSFTTVYGPITTQPNQFCNGGDSLYGKIGEPGPPDYPAELAVCQQACVDKGDPCQMWTLSHNANAPDGPSVLVCLYFGVGYGQEGSYCGGTYGPDYFVAVEKRGG